MLNSGIKSEIEDSSNAKKCVKVSPLNLATFSFVVCFVLLLVERWSDCADSVTRCVSQALLLSLVGWIFIAIPLKLLLFPARRLCRFVYVRLPESGKKPELTQSSERRIGCVDRKVSGQNLEMQLWIHWREGDYFFEIKQWFVTSVRYIRACTLETGKPQASYQLALEQGQEAMKRLLES